jgi:hypothetical protein
MRIAIYSANIGGYEKFYDHVEQSVKCDHIMFTDNPPPAGKSHVIYRPVEVKSGISNHMAYKKLKILPEVYMPGYDYTIWIDGNMKVDSPFFVEECLDMLGDGSFGAARHTSTYINVRREDIFDEIIESKQYGSYPDEPFSEIVDMARNAGYPSMYGLWLSGFLVRSKGAARLNSTWALLNDKFSRSRPQCQVTLSLASYLSDFKITDIGEPGFVYDNNLFSIYWHGGEHEIRKTIDVTRI